MKLLDQVREAIRVRHYSIRTEHAYVEWITRYILFHDKRHPGEMGAAEINRFLSHLASDLNVAASTQNQALCAIRYRHADHRTRAPASEGHRLCNAPAGSQPRHPHHPGASGPRRRQDHNDLYACDARRSVRDQKSADKGPEDTGRPGHAGATAAAGHGADCYGCAASHGQSPQRPFRRLPGKRCLPTRCRHIGRASFGSSLRPPEGRLGGRPCVC